MKKIVEILKKRWLINTTKTTILVAVLIALFIFLNLFVKNLELPSIDVTKEKLYSLSEESKEKIKNIDQNVTIYFFGYSSSNQAVDLANLYSKVNEKIAIEVIEDISSRPDLAEEYGVSSGATGIVVQSPTRNKILSVSDLYSYDYSTGQEVDLTEQKLTNAIIDTTISKKPHLYYLSGHKEITSLSILTTYMENEVNTVSSLNLLTSDFPEDCDLLMIFSPSTDFTEYESNLIIQYIQNGGNILWLNNIPTTDLPNVQKVLDQYGVSLSKGIVQEESSDSMLLKQPSYIVPNLSYHPITKNIITDGSIIFFEAGKLNFVDDDTLTSLSVTVNPLITSSDTSYLRTDYSNSSTTALDSEEKGSFYLGAELVKQINDSTESKLVIYTNTNFVTDNTITIGNQAIPAVTLASNKDIILNTTSYLTDREDSITIRKNTSSVTYTATASEDTIIRIIIFIGPILIIVIGIIIWQIRRRKR